jgi:leucyl aminopeptidase
MNFEWQTLDLAATAKLKTDALLVLVPEGIKVGSDAVSFLLGHALKSGDFEAKPGRLLSAYRVAGVAADRLIFVGVGEGLARQVRTGLQAALSHLKADKLKKLGVFLATNTSSAAVVRTVVQTVAESTYVFTTSKPKAEPRSLKSLTLGLPDAPDALTQQAFARAVAVVEGVELAKQWGNRPGNMATPTLLGQAAQALAKESAKISCEVLTPREVAKLGMGSFMAVAQGSHEPLRFIVLKYQGAAKSDAPIVLVGKGITFDTGGISLKPGAEMDEMKFDMCGAASVLGTFRALADLQPKINVVGLIPAAENMPSGAAIKPGDVVTSMSGQTIEILNTDAEGRLVLCDALTYAERFKPRAVVDIATLTGACVIALGGVRSGLFSTSDALAQALLDAGESSQDLAWRMPLDEDYGEGLKSNFADMANVAGRPGGSITAAKFLQRFASEFPWAHLDIAGTAWKSGAAKGATGRPVPLLVDYLLAEAATPSVKPKKVKKKA